MARRSRRVFPPLSVCSTPSSRPPLFSWTAIIAPSCSWRENELAKRVIVEALRYSPPAPPPPEPYHFRARPSFSPESGTIRAPAWRRGARPGCNWRWRVCSLQYRPFEGEPDRRSPIRAASVMGRPPSLSALPRGFVSRSQLHLPVFQNSNMAKKGAKAGLLTGVAAVHSPDGGWHNQGRARTSALDLQIPWPIMHEEDRSL